MVYLPFISEIVSKVLISYGKTGNFNPKTRDSHSGSSVKPEATITEAVNAVINEDESHREVI